VATAFTLSSSHAIMAYRWQRLHRRVSIRTILWPSTAVFVPRLRALQRQPFFSPASLGIAQRQHDQPPDISATLRTAGEQPASACIFLFLRVVNDDVSDKQHLTPRLRVSKRGRRSAGWRQHGGGAAWLPADAFSLAWRRAGRA